MILIILSEAFFRIYGLNWDQGNHLHPDERAIVMFTTPLQFPKNISEFMSPQSTWNPHFFAYGSFPIYLLKIIGNILSIFNPSFSTYDQINILGRAMSAFFDIGTILVLFFLTKKLFHKKIALIAAFFYSISVLPIQLSHFYAVDTLLTFFILSTLYQLIRFYEKPTLVKAVSIGILFGLSLATKISAIVLLSSIGVALAVDFFLIFLKQPHRPYIWFPHMPKFLKRLFIDGFIIAVVTIITFVFFESYAIIDFQTFLRQNLEQQHMTYDAFTFPYTLQYVGIIPYWYELKNIFLWGLGPILATLAFLGTIYLTLKTSHHLYSSSEEQSDESRSFSSRQARTIILLSFFWVYFAIVGHFAIGFMRYMLPLYPLLCLFAAVLAYKLLLNLKSYFLNHKSIFIILNSLFIILILVWPLSFMHIYTQPNTRVSASNWINQNIPPGKTLAVEHWDDGLPLFGVEKYRIVTLPLYESDTPQKWAGINQQLAQTDYIIIASNRLYVPLMKMTDCKKLPPGRCYVQTTQYYNNLFGGSLGFQKVAEFSIYPSLILNHSSFIINDSSADESFTVYDHPKVMIFKKN